MNLDLQTSRCWGWPSSSDFTITSHVKISIDQTLEKLCSLSSQYAVEDRNLSWVKGEGLSFDRLFQYRIYVYDLEGKFQLKSSIVKAITTIFCEFSKGGNLSQCVAYIGKKIGADCRNTIYVGVDLIQKKFVILKKIETPREKVFHEKLVESNHLLARYYIHPISSIFHEQGCGDSKEISSWLVQNYCPQGNLKDLMRRSRFSIFNRLLFCADMIDSIFFLHQIGPWEFTNSSGRKCFILKTSHSDIKLENFLVEYDEEEKREKAILIDHEFAGRYCAAGTPLYYDPQKMSLYNLLKKRWKRDWSSLQNETPFPGYSFEKLKSKALSDEEENRIIHDFGERYGQAQDVWALGLVLLSVILNKIYHEEFFSFERHRFYSPYQSFLKQENMDLDLQRMREGLFLTNDFGKDVVLDRQVEKIFRVIQRALTIDYAKRVDSSSMHKVAQRIRREIQWKKEEDMGVEEIRLLFA